MMERMLNDLSHNSNSEIIDNNCLLLLYKFKAEIVDF